MSTNENHDEITHAHDHDYFATRFGQAHYKEGQGSRSYRHCSYCGSCHPADLAKSIREHGTKVHFADWKYGWPHKVYVEPPNPNDFIKFYSLHLMDATPEDKATIESRQGLKIDFRDGNIYWSPAT